jgi:iron complex outermembrane receptor protein
MRRLAVLALASLQAGMSWAQSAGDAPATGNPAASRDRLDEIRIWAQRERPFDLTAPSTAGSRLGLSSLETPAALEVISGYTIRQRGDLNLVDAATRATGITSVANPGNGGTALGARGFSGHGSVTQLVDGTRLSVGAGTVTFPFDPWMVERIEVLRGPASVLYGEGAIGGAINVVSKQPSSARQDFEAQVGFGSDDTLRAALGAGGPIDSVLSYRFDVSRQMSDGWFDRAESESVAASGALRLDVRDDLALTLSHDYGEQEPMRYFGTPLLDGAFDDRTRERNYNVADSQLRYIDNWTRLKAEWQPSDAVTVRNDLYRLTTNRVWRNVESYFWNDSAQAVDRFDYIAIRHDQTQIGDRADLTLHQTFGGRQNDLVLGVDVNQINFKHTNNSPYGGDSAVDPLNPVPGQFIDLAGTLPRYHTFTKQTSAFAEDRFVLSERWSVVGGLRADRVEVRRDNLVSGATLFAETLDSVGGRLGLVFRPSGTLSFYGQYARGTDPLGSLITLSVAQKDFDLATGEQFEIGLKQAFADDRGEWTLAAYDITKKKLLTRDPENPGVALQVGERSARGIEATLAFRLGAGLLVEANATVLEAKFEDFAELSGGALVSRNRNVPPNTPEETANLWLTWELASRWQARAGLRYVGETFSDNANTFAIPNYTVVDAGVSFAVSESVRASLRGYNLFDEVYATNTYNDEQWLLGRPRSVDLSIDVRF